MAAAPALAETCAAAHGCIVTIREEKLYFLCPRRQDGKGCELAPGGAREQNESVLEGMLREIAEEFAFNQYGVFFDFKPVQQTQVCIPGRPRPLALFLFIAPEGFPEFIDTVFKGSDEVTEAAWVEWGEWNGVLQTQLTYFKSPLEIMLFREGIDAF